MNNVAKKGYSKLLENRIVSWKWLGIDLVIGQKLTFIC